MFPALFELRATARDKGCAFAVLAFKSVEPSSRRSSLDGCGWHQSASSLFSSLSLCWGASSRVHAVCDSDSFCAERSPLCLSPFICACLRFGVVRFSHVCIAWSAHNLRCEWKSPPFSLPTSTRPCPHVTLRASRYNMSRNRHDPHNSTPIKHAYYIHLNTTTLPVHLGTRGNERGGESRRNTCILTYRRLFQLRLLHIHRPS